MTKKDATAVARRTVACGRVAVSDSESYVNCPCCGERVSAHLSAHERIAQRLTWGPVLRAALVAHLTDLDEPCAHSRCAHLAEAVAR